MKSTDQQINRSTLSCFLLLAMLFAVGCDTQMLAVGTVADRPVTPPEEVLIDAGIVFADRASYLCLPFEKVGLPTDASVVSIESSCDCVSPSLVTYATSESSRASGILLQYGNESTFHGDDPKSLPALPPANLRVVFVLTLAGGRSYEFAVNLLHTHLVQQTPDDEAHPQ